MCSSLEETKKQFIEVQIKMKTLLQRPGAIIFVFVEDISSFVPVEMGREEEVGQRKKYSPHFMAREF